uniref:PA domain-containing protein n=1 Tax=Chrysemys picta bellii TaxID=8478 RepID=A0A8C3FYA3_CHRPI
MAEVFVYVVYKQNSTCIDFRALSACLGPPVPREGLRGYLIEAVPANACHPIGGPPAASNSSAAFIALISRYDCPLGVKILHAQQAGYQAAIVHNVNSETLVTMVTNVEEIRQKIGIPSVFTGESASKKLRRVMGSEKGIHGRPVRDVCDLHGRVRRRRPAEDPPLFSRLSLRVYRHLASHPAQE